MSKRYESQVNTPRHFHEASLFLSHISLDTHSNQRNKHIYRRSLSERPDVDSVFPWGFNEQTKLQRFSSYQFENASCNKDIKFAKDIRKEESTSKFLFVSHSSNSILAIFTVLPYSNQQESAVRHKKEQQVLDIERESSGYFAQTVSYASLLVNDDSVHLYDPFCLENPEIKSVNKTDITLDGPMIVSFLEFESPDLFKKDGNIRFKEKFPQVDITLSKIKSIKRDLLKVANTTHLPVVVICYAFAYFETLAFAKYINKPNRKLAAGACLMLARKFLHCNVSILQDLEEVLRVSRENIVIEEFKVLAALKFSLHYPESAIIPHYERLLDPSNRIYHK